MRPVVFISGLGMDKRIFQLLRLPGIEPHYMQWVPPLNDESLEAYAKRFADRLTFQRPILVGISFGGLLAMEISRHIPVEKIILISSIRSRKEMPLLYKVCAAMRLNRLIPSILYKKANSITNFFFGVRSSSDKKLLKNIMAETDTLFLRWAVEKALHWDGNANNPNVIQIHGSEDRILPLGYTHPDYVIRGGDIAHINEGARAKRNS